MRQEPVLVLGATGYVGGRLVQRLIQDGRRVRASARNKAKLAARPWANHPMVETVQADVLDLKGLTVACRGCWAVFYLVHSMDPYNKDFIRTDRQAAENMVRAAASAGVGRIVYLGGLAPESQKLSHHLASREEVARILKSGPVPTTVFRAAMILGSGSASFEIMRYLVERLPIMPAPRQVDNLVQPISIRNVLGYLVGCLEHETTVGRDFQICGPEKLSYRELFHAFAEEAGLPRRWIPPLPGLTPRLCSYLIHLITPVHASLARPLAEGLQNTAVCTDDSIRSIIPQDLMDVHRTIRRVLVKEQRQIVETSWIDAGSALPHEWVQSGDAEYAGGTVIAKGYDVHLAAGCDEVWERLVRIGGETGWYFADFLWRLRGWADKVVGGVGSKRGRRRPVDLVEGDPLDFWRVVEVRKGRRLLLMSEMKTPGEMVLGFRLAPLEDGGTELQLVGRFLPKGLWGLIYYYALFPFHTWLYKGVLKGLAGRTGGEILAGPAGFTPGPGRRCPFERSGG